MKVRTFFLIVFVCSTTLIAADSVKDQVSGLWTGKGKVYKGFFSKMSIDTCDTDSVDIFLSVDETGNVTGHIGDAVFVDCFVESNRGWLGRLLNFKTDFIVKGGYLEGNIVPTDTVKYKYFTIPFNIKENQLKGTLMQIHKWKYPDPLVRVVIYSDETTVVVKNERK